MSDFAERLDKLRREGEAKKDFARRIGISPVQLSRYYSGIQPGRKVLERIADNTGASVDWLLQGGGEEGSKIRARRQGAMTNKVLKDKDRVEIACSYLDELKGSSRSSREAIKEIVREIVKNPESLDKISAYLGFLRFERSKASKRKHIGEV